MRGTVLGRVARRWRRVVRSGVSLAAAACVTAAVAPAVAEAAPTPAGQSTTPYSVALNYTIRFYPRFITYAQQSLGKTNYLNGPDGMGPLYGAVVAINDDTLYANFFLDLGQGPEIFTIPSTNVTYSLLTMDAFGNAFQTDIHKQTPGTYALVQQGWHGSLPAGVTEIPIPYRFSIWAIRADKYSASGQNMIAEATAFRASMHLAALPAYEQNPAAGATQVLPLRDYALRAKAIADRAVESYTTVFFRVVQVALRSPTTPLSASDVQLSNAFNRVYAAANEAARRGNPGPLSVLINAARTAHSMIVDRWVSHVDANRWVYFGNIAAWGTAYLDRAAATEFCQFCNTAATAGYYDAFTDGRGAPLNGANHEYRLTFSKAEIPQAERFWSLTAYIPPGITLVPNAARKYVVARYTPGLRPNPDGSITIYLQATPPTPDRLANWLPVPRGPFSVMLRVYGPEGNTTPGTYVPPKITTSP